MSTYLPLILTAFVAVFTSVTAPLLLIYLSNRQRRLERQEDWDRQDAQAQKINAKVDVVKTLVNGEKTAAMQRALDDQVRQRVMLEQIIGLTEKAGDTVDPDARASLAATELRIRELEAELAERHRHFELAQKQMDANPVFDEGEQV